ncbi:branched-chain amino acid transport system II carrier protein [Sporosarcina oncorhynchi]|uniref:Branched-chain amino acid transport system carrier protein n=1 Tax=Sporosarcina oncorhynchi TaxID=3056444 RepID=A0ABZ0L291_9BACL|nr:branched-chain amino acid transport system II carrier protein [Sporosarcina sp. T2O-4]WOV86736.1 branched-chain amino acid transport system II carrier protein [Sporosarcina sp. T2O-4]
MNQFKPGDTIKLGLVVFALFFGAGNMIFPPLVGQQAGTAAWMTIAGFLLTGVGLPFLGVVAVARSGDQLSDLAGKAHPLFGIVFTVAVYLSIGPLFGIPRTATVAFEIAASPFVSASYENLTLMLFTILFFGVTAWLALTPNKIVDRIGKILTPILLVIVATIVIIGILKPAGVSGPPQAEYLTNPFASGFIKGYLTMDAIAALVFGIIVINAIKAKGITDRKVITKLTMKSGFIAVTGLSLVYIGLAYLGMTSRTVAPDAENGGIILAKLAYELMGTNGQLLLGAAVLLACLTTSVGLVSACATFFSMTFPKISYKWVVLVISIFSTFIANIGLTQLISITLPILIGIYPLAIVLICLSFFHSLFKGYPFVYLFALAGAGVIGFFDMLKEFGIIIAPVTRILTYLPLYEEGIGWIVPAILLAVVGYIYGLTTHTKRRQAPRQ